MQMELLELFVAVVERGGMTAAGREKGISQPAVSRSMRNLERQLGVQLFRREGRGVVPTEAGELAYQRLLVVTKDWQALVEELRQMAAGPSEVRIAIPFGTARVLIPVLVRRAATSPGEMRVEVVEVASADGLTAVADRDCAASVCYLHSHVSGDQVAVDSQPGGSAVALVRTERLFAVGTAKFLGRGSERIRLGDLVGRPLLLPGPAWPIRHLIDSAFAGIQAVPTVAREVGVSEALVAFALEGEGISILPYSNVIRECELGTLVAREIAEPAIERQIGVAVGPGVTPHLAEGLRDLITQSINEVAATACWRPL